MNTIQKEVISQFDFPGEVVECVAYGSGHINDTYRLTVKNTGRTGEAFYSPENEQKHFHKAGRAYGERAGRYCMAPQKDPGKRR